MIFPINLHLTFPLINQPQASAVSSTMPQVRVSLKSLQWLSNVHPDIFSLELVLVGYYPYSTSSEKFRNTYSSVTLQYMCSNHCFTKIMKKGSFQKKDAFSLSVISCLEVLNCFLTGKWALVFECCFT
jgi:hypothetical protein